MCCEQGGHGDVRKMALAEFEFDPNPDIPKAPPPRKPKALRRKSEPLKPL